MDKTETMLEGFSKTLDKPWTSHQIVAHAEGLAADGHPDLHLLQKALHRAYNNHHLYFQGKPSVAQIKGLMDDIWQEEQERRKDAELADGRSEAKMMATAASRTDQKDTATKCLSLLWQRMDGLITKQELEARVKEATE